MSDRLLFKPILTLLIAIACLSPISIAAEADRNAALRYWRAVWLMGEDSPSASIDYEGLYQPNYNHAPNGEAPYSSSQLLQDQSEVIRLLIEASLLEECDFGVDYDKGVEALLPHLSPMRRAAQLLVLDARRLLSEGDKAGATERVTAAYRLAEHMTGDLTLINSLVSMACFSLVDSFVETHESSFDDAHRQAIAQAIARFDADDPFGCAKAVRGEATFFGGWMLRRVGNEWSTPDAFVADLRTLFDVETAENLRAEMFAAEAGTGEAFRQKLRREIEKYATALNLMADAWTTPDAEKSLDAIESQIVDGGFGAVAQVMAPSLGRCHASDMKARATLQARLEWARD